MYDMKFDVRSGLMLAIYVRLLSLQIIVDGLRVVTFIVFMSNYDRIHDVELM